MSIQRSHVGPRMSQIVVRGDTVYLAGQVASDKPGAPVGEQTKNILDKIDGYLAEAGTDKSKLLTATIWITDVATFNDMNAVWDAWVDPENPPARACVEATLAAPEYTVEIMVVAAK
ncbi:MAG TPA: RidA family protein [Alphaproteobacteria bacterium]|nr:RidA family protein [Alphaproteobacteria bacterium]